VAPVIAAAGAVVWRGSPNAPEIALVHRPAYGDWSFPKGKLDDGEHVIAAAVREVREELGSVVRLGVRLPTAHYTVRGDSKRVDYWAAEHITGTFEPDDEIDQVKWVSLTKARSRLTYTADRRLLDAFTDVPLGTTASIAVRHAKARSRSSWTAPDPGRPLTARGERQAQSLATTVAAAYGGLRVITSPWLRCVQTVEPYALEVSATVELLDVLGEDEFEDDPGFAASEVARIVEATPAVMLCSHGNVMADLVDVLAGGRRRVMEPLGSEPMAKGEVVIVHRASGRPVTAERHLF
jgi:8-oxo-dGTP diphosphatase